MIERAAPPCRRFALPDPPPAPPQPTNSSILKSSTLAAMLRGKNPGLVILWLWTIGTAAVLVTNVARTRLRDMEKLIEEEEARSRAERMSPGAQGLDTVLDEE
ncbi:hypothetical protein ACLOJK_005941 [Asimina triloba]